MGKISDLYSWQYFWHITLSYTFIDAWMTTSIGCVVKSDVDNVVYARVLLFVYCSSLYYLEFLYNWEKLSHLFP